MRGSVLIEEVYFFDLATVLFVLLSGWFLLFLVLSVCFRGGDHNNWKAVPREAYRVLKTGGGDVFFGRLLAP